MLDVRYTSFSGLVQTIWTTENATDINYITHILKRMDFKRIKPFERLLNDWYDRTCPECNVQSSVLGAEFYFNSGTDFEKAGFSFECKNPKCHVKKHEVFSYHENK